MLKNYCCQECGCGFISVERGYAHRYGYPECPVCGCDDMLRSLPSPPTELADEKFIIENLIDLGGKRWTKGDLDRIYLPAPVLHQLLDDRLTVDKDKLMYSLHECKFYYDVVRMNLDYKHSQGCVDLHSEVFNSIDWYLNEKYTAEKTAKAEREVSVDDLDEALGL